MSLKRLFFRGLLGIPIGVFCMTTAGLIISIFLGELAMNPPPIWDSATPLITFAIFYFASCLIGFTFGAASIIFEIERWSLAKQMLIYFLITSFVFLPASGITRWIMLDDYYTTTVYFSVFIFIYLIIWLVQYLIWKRKIQKLNEGLAKK